MSIGIVLVQVCLVAAGITVLVCGLMGWRGMNGRQQ